MDRIAGHAKELLQANHSAIFLPDPDGKTLTAPWSSCGEDAEAIRATTVQAGVGIIGNSARKAAGAGAASTTPAPTRAECRSPAPICACDERP